jgi:hypothetical protein
MFRAIFLGVCGLLFWGFAELAAQTGQSKTPTRTQQTITELPVHRKGLTLNQIASCRVIDQLPWVFRKTNRKSRLLLRDRLRLSTDSDFSTWEVHQVMDQNGYISYVFRRPLSDGRFESIVTKENFYNRIIDSGGTRVVADARNLSTLIDRPALTFYAEDESYAVYMPGLAGKNSFVVTYKGGVAPLYLRGPSCDRVNALGENPYEPSSGGSEAGAGAAPAAGN